MPDPYTLRLEQGNMLQMIDPNVTGDRTRIDEGAYFRLIGPLDPGDHLLVTSARYDLRAFGGDDVVRYRTFFRLHVS